MFRFVESFLLCPSHTDTIPGLPSQAHVAMQYMKDKYMELLGKLTVDKINLSLKPLPW